MSDLRNSCDDATATIQIQLQLSPQERAIANAIPDPI